MSRNRNQGRPVGERPAPSEKQVAARRAFAEAQRAKARPSTIADVTAAAPAGNSMTAGERDAALDEPAIEHERTVTSAQDRGPDAFAPVDTSAHQPRLEAAPFGVLDRTVDRSDPFHDTPGLLGAARRAEFDSPPIEGQSVTPALCFATSESLTPGNPWPCVTPAGHPGPHYNAQAGQWDQYPPVQDWPAFRRDGDA